MCNYFFIRVFIAFLYFVPNAVLPFQSTIHQENVCIGFGGDDRPECKTIRWDKRPWSDCYKNTPSVLIEDDSYAYNVLSEVCPWYISTEPSSTRVCCGVGQMNALRSAVKMLQQYFEQCPVCLRNLINILCAITCDPSNSLFMNPGNSSEFVFMKVYFTNTYANKFYDSCRDTVFLQERGNAITHYCFNEIWCESSGQDLLEWIGRFDSLIYYAALQFIFTNYTTGGIIPENMSAHNDTMLSCDQPVGGIACSFSNCPATCPAPPNIPHTIGSVKVTSDHLGIFVSFVMYNTAFIILIIVYLCFTDSRSMHTKISIFSESKSPAGCGHELLISKLFSKWGCITVNHWALIVSIALILSSVCCAGLMFVDEATDPVELWSKQDGRARKEKEYFEEHFGPLHRTTQIIITAPNSSNFSFLDFQNYRTFYYFGGIFQQSVLNEIWLMQNDIINLHVPVKAANGTEYNITLQDICYQPLYPHNKKCKISSVLNYFQNDYQLLNKHITPLFTDSGNSSYHIHYCNKDPYFLNESSLLIPCLAEYGEPVDPTIALGGYNTVNGSAQYDLSKAIIITFYIYNYVDKELNKPAEQWEHAFVNYLKNYKKRVKNSSLEFSFTPRNFIPSTELDHEDLADIHTAAISYSLMFLYIVFFMSGLARYAVYGLWDNDKHSGRVLVSSRIGLGVLGVILMVLSVAASIGLLSYFRIKTTLIITEVVPFLVLAVGTDNLFILTHAYERKQQCKPGVPVSQIVGDALGEVGPSILVTSLTEIAVFLLGVISTVPAVRTFSIFAGIAVLINFLLQISVFVTVLGLNSKRMARYYLAVHQLTETRKDNQESFLLYLTRQYYAPIVLHKCVRILVMYSFGVLFFGMLLVIFNKGSSSNVPLKNSFSSSDDYIKDLIKYSKVGLPVYFVIKDGFDYSNEDNQNKICFEAAWCGPCNSVTMQIFRASQIPEHSKIAIPAINWLDSYFEWINPLSGCCMVLDRKVYNDTRCSNQSDPMCQPCLSDPSIFTYRRPDPNEFMHYLPWYFNVTISNCSLGFNTMYRSTVDYVDQNKTIEASYLMTYHTVLAFLDIPDMLKTAREYASNFSTTLDHEVFAYNILYIFYEQYLTIKSDTILTLSISLSGVLVMSFLLMGFNVLSALIVTGTVVIVIVDMIGMMVWMEIPLNAVSLVNLVLAVGVSVEFCSHIVQWFVHSHCQSRVEKAKDAIVFMGTSVLSGMTFTKLLGVSVLVFVHSQVYLKCYVEMYLLIIVLGALHGLVFLPVVLSFIGPCSHAIKEDDNKYEPADPNTVSSLDHSLSDVKLKRSYTEDEN